MTDSPPRGTSDPFDDLGTQILDLKESIAQARQEARRAAGKRRRQIEWWIFGAIKHLDRLANVATARKIGEHRFIVHEMDGQQIWAICSCGARFRGQMHVDFGETRFTDLTGHLL